MVNDWPNRTNLGLVFNTATLSAFEWPVSP